MSLLRKFSTTASSLVSWAIKGTTKNVAAHLLAIDRGINEHEKLSWLAQKVSNGLIDGNPHETNRNGVMVDLNHISGIIGIGNLKKSRDRFSFHYYPEERRLRFNNVNIPDIILPKEWIVEAEKECEQLWMWDVKKVKTLRWDQKRNEYVEGFLGKPEERPWADVESKK